MNHKRGFAAILIIFILGLISLLIAGGLIVTGYNESIMARSGSTGTRAFYIANSGVEEAIHRLNKDETYSGGLIPFDDGKAVITVVPVIGDSKQRTIESIGTAGQYGTTGPYVSRIHAVVKNTLVSSSFNYAIQAGNGGIELDQKTTVIGENDASGNPTNGDVWSDTTIKGKNNGCNPHGSGCPDKCTGESVSGIMGYATAVTAFSKLAETGTDSGVCVEKNASSSAFTNCYIKGIPSGPSSSAPNANLCPISTPGSYKQVIPGPSAIGLPQGLDTLVTDNLSEVVPWSGSCVANLSGDSSDCTKGNDHIGNLVVDGDMTIDIPNGKTLYVSGPVWVKNTLTINSNGIISIDPEGEYSQIFVVEKTITSASNVSFGSTGNLFLLFLSKLTTPPNTCTDKVYSINLSSNANSVLFYAPNGCVYVSPNSAFHGAIAGQLVHVSNESTIAFNHALIKAVFATSAMNGWQIASFRQD
jgi:hypothetical protein